MVFLTRQTPVLSPHPVSPRADLGTERSVPQIPGVDLERQRGRMGDRKATVFLGMCLVSL